MYVYFVCGMDLSSLRVSLLIVIGERKLTRALHDEILYPSTSSAASSASVGVSVGAPQTSPAACVSSLSPSLCH